MYKVTLKSVTATGDPVSNKQCFFTCEKRLPLAQVEEPYLYWMYVWRTIVGEDIEEGGQERRECFSQGLEFRGQEGVKLFRTVC